LELDGRLTPQGHHDGHGQLETKSSSNSSVTQIVSATAVAVKLPAGGELLLDGATHNRSRHLAIGTDFPRNDVAFPLE
jgi:hypothetical protein